MIKPDNAPHDKHFNVTEGCRFFNDNRSNDPLLPSGILSMLTYFYNFEPKNNEKHLLLINSISSLSDNITKAYTIYQLLNKLELMTMFFNPLDDAKLQFDDNLLFEIIIKLTFRNLFSNSTTIIFINFFDSYKFSISNKL